MYFATACAVLVTLVAGCGDNSKECGPGTEDQDGTCIATCGPNTVLNERGECAPDFTIICANGTILDPASGHCVIDPASCQAGTVLIGGECRDPTADDLVDLQEGSEPNGLGIQGEPSVDPAGVIALPATGAYVLHGSIVPADHDTDGALDNDIDAYTLAVDGPVLLSISADGVNGLAAGFLAIAATDANDPLATFARYGLNVTGDTSRRQVFLPRAGTYVIAIGDTRSFLLPGDTGSGAVAGAEPGATAFEYYVSLESVAIPTATPMTVTGMVATSPPADTLAGDAKFFSVAMGAGFNRVTLGLATQQAIPSFVILASTATVDDELRTLANGRRSGATVLPADTFVGGFAPTDVTVIVVDPIMNYAVEPESYGLVVNLATAVALSTTGGAVAAPELATTANDLSKLTGFFLDVAADDTITGLALTFDQAVDVVLVDRDRRVVSSFTHDPIAGPVRDTMTSYRGLVRFPTAGRYYFMAYEPAGTGATTITATSTIATLAATPVTSGTPLAASPIDNTYRSAPFSFTPDGPWQEFDVSGVNTGASLVSFFDPTTAYGRLDPLVIQPGSVTLPPDAPEIFEESFAQGGGAIGRVVLDDNTASYLVRVRPTSSNPTSAKTVTLDFAPRAFHDFATVAAGQSPSATGQTLTSAIPTRRYLVRTASGNRVTITVDPTGAPPVNLQNLAFDRLAADESVTQTVNAPGINASDVAQFVQTGNGWTAFAVRSTTPVVLAENFAVLLDVLAP